MSRCFPFPPPGYEKNNHGSGGESGGATGLLFTIKVKAETKIASPTVSLKRTHDINQEEVGDSSKCQSQAVSIGTDSPTAKHPRIHQSSSAFPSMYYRGINDTRIQMVETSLRIFKDSLKVCLSNPRRYRGILGALEIFEEIINFNRHAKASFMDIITALDSLKVSVSDLLKGIDSLNLDEIKERIAAEIPVLSVDEQKILDMKTELSEMFKSYSQEVQQLFSGASVSFLGSNQLSILLSDLQKDIESFVPVPLSIEDIAKKAEEEVDFSRKFYEKQVDQAIQNFLLRIEELDAHQSEAGEELSKK